MKIHLRCIQHGVIGEIDGVTKTRKFILPRNRLGAMRCALLMAHNPQAGTVHIPDPDTGQDSRYSCEIVQDA